MKTLGLLLLPLLAVAQESVLPTPTTASQAQPFGRRWSVSIAMLGWQSLGPATAIKQKMEETGWASVAPGGCFFSCSGATPYPAIRRNSTFDLDVGYRKTKRHGYQVGIGLSQNSEVTGRTPGYSYLNLKSVVWSTSVRWAWFSRNGRFVNSVGPALLLFQDYESVPYGQGIARHSQIRPGMHVSSQFRFVDRRTWLLAFKMDIRAGLPVSTGQYERTEYVYSTTSTTLKTVQFSGTNLSITHINVGLYLGFKIL